MGSRGRTGLQPAHPPSIAPVSAPLTGGWIALLALIAVVLLAQRGGAPGAASAGQPIRPRSAAAEASYAAQAADLIARTRSTVADGDRLLAQHDADPSLGADPGWVAAHAATVEALAAAHQRALELRPGPDDAGLQGCLTESLRLLWTGHALLQSAFKADGHHAYHDSSHGNWDLDLGVNRLRACEQQLEARR